MLGRSFFFTFVSSFFLHSIFSIVVIVFLFSFDNLCLIGSKLPEKILHSFVPNEVSGSHHGHGHQQSENEKGEAPLGEQRVGKTSRGWRR